MKKFMCAALLLLCLSALHHSCNGQVSTSATKDVKAVEKAKDDHNPVEVIENEYYDEAVIVDGEYYYYPMEALDISSGKGVNVGIRGINTRPIYTWADENLYCKVQSYVETADNYRMTKKFDENGRIVYYNFQSPLFSHDVYPLGCPVPIIHEKQQN